MSEELNLWQDILPDLGMVDRLLKELLPQKNVSSMDFMEDVLKGNWVLEPDLFWQYLKEAVLGVMADWKSLFVSVLVLFIAAAVVNGFMQAFKNDGAAHAARTFFILCELIVLVNAFRDVLAIVSEAMERMLEFLKIMLPAYMICIAAAGSGLTALIFYKLLLGFLCLIEGIIAASLVPIVEGYVMLGVVESIWGEGRFQAIMDIMKKVVQWVMKGMIVLLSGSSILQIIITPVSYTHLTLPTK